MAHISKDRGRWRAQVARMGVRKSQSFDTKAEAQAWAIAEESAVLGGKRGVVRKTLRDAIDRYLESVDRREERLRLEAFCRDYGHIANLLIGEVTTAHLAEWRDSRLKQVKPASVARGITTLRGVFRLAHKEWGWIQSDPFANLKAPPEAPPRRRLPTRREIKALCRQLGYERVDTGTKSQLVAVAFLISLRTAMRAGEILTLSHDTVDFTRRVVTLDKHKTAAKAGRRLVPFSLKALSLIKRFCKLNGKGNLSAQSLDALFRKAKGNQLIDDLHFHDARAYALTHLAKRVPVLELARISGHKNLNELLTYYRESEADIAARL